MNFIFICNIFFLVKYEDGSFCMCEAVCPAVTFAFFLLLSYVCYIYVCVCIEIAVVIINISGCQVESDDIAYILLPNM